ncbi:HypC/HybG/HupF family hydrogenase formation chaperone [Paraburkholderia ferrariae]|uniref:HypC/HybG/HupF family hydrogenase formation chaperone n=1 Tax=Paraburkholderia ferrariae TaxID=386056 RepID=A0ABU9S1U6_9BURK
MRVIEVQGLQASCDGRCERRRIDTSLVGPCSAGEWLLVFLDAAREKLDATRAAEIDATLSLVERALAGDAAMARASAHFELPSALGVDDLIRLTGGARHSPVHQGIDVTNTGGAAHEVAPVVQRLIDDGHAEFVDERTLDDWLADSGECVVLLAGDPVRFPESLDVAVVLPELARLAEGRFGRPLRVAVATREGEDAIARRVGSQRRPALLWLRDGGYVTTLAGMMDWDDYVANVAHALAQPTTRVPSVGIPVNAAGASADCHYPLPSVD